MKRVAVFCGSRVGARPAYMTVAHELGASLARHGVGIVYGGAHVGLMGAVADGALSEGGDVHGVIPQALVDRELEHPRLTKLERVDTMHQRKAIMAEAADGFVVLPGGIGTLEEIFEAWTWRYIGYHTKPCVLVDVEGYWARLEGFLEHMVVEGFLTRETLAMLVVARSVPETLAALKI